MPPLSEESSIFAQSRVGSGYGFRQNGAQKGQGWLGPLERADGRVSSELGVGVRIRGKETSIPLLVPTLNKYEINYLLNTNLNSKTWQTPVGKEIMRKAYLHAVDRIEQGLSPFKD